MADDPAQKIINDFLRSMKTGKPIQQVVAGGSLAPCTVQLDRDVSTMTLEPKRRGGVAKSRSFGLTDIDKIAVGDEDDCEGVPLPPREDLCVTLVVGEEAFVFRFNDLEERDTFAYCLAMFVDERRNEEGSVEQENDVLSHALESVGGDPAPPGRLPRGREKASKPAFNDIWGGDADVAEERTIKDTHTASRSSRSSGGSRGGSNSGKPLSDAQKLVKKFVEKMVKGRTLKMLSPKGNSIDCFVHLDRDLTIMYIGLAARKDAKERDVPLKDVEQVSVGMELADEVDQPIDEFCVTLVLTAGQAISFRLNDEEERDTFAMCLAIFVDGNRKKSSRRKTSSSHTGKASAFQKEKVTTL